MFRLAFFLALGALASAQETLFRQVSDVKTDSHVEVTALFSKPAPRGFLPLHIRIANRLEGERSARLSFTSTAGVTMKSEFDFDTPGEKTVDHDILVPLAAQTSSGSYTTLTVNAELAGGFGSAAGSLSFSLDDRQPAVLLSEKLFTPNASKLDAATNSKFSGGYRAREFAGKFDPRLLPDDWRAWSGYDCVMMTDGDWTAALPGARNALLAWVRLGGHLVVFSETSTTASLGLPQDTSFGTITVRPIGSSLALDPSETLALASFAKPGHQSLREDYSSTWPLQKHFGGQSFNYALFIIVLIAFGVMVGPVNLFVFAKSGRRHRLFVTTPLISLAASLLLIALIVLQDGFGGRGMRVVLMEVRPDHNENAAYIHQEQFSRTGVLTGGRFKIDENISLAPVPIADSRWARLTNSASYYPPRGQANYSLNPSDGKLAAAGDWFQSRSEQGHELDAVVPTRGRIELVTAAGEPELLSTFEFPLETVFYLDSAKQWWRAEQIQPGVRFKPVAIATSMVNPVLYAERARFGDRHEQALNRITERPGAFLAIAPAAPGIATYPGIKWKETHTVVTGPVVKP
ncbi:MAG TPA: hypothetical protein VIM57_02280 [Luteolibacter sp.]